MTVIRISRKKICDAIEKEPTKTLSPGAWVKDADGEALDGNAVNFATRIYDWDVGMENPELAPKLNSKDCSVCAVGAVMRSVLDPEQAVNAIASASMTSLGVGRADAGLNMAIIQAKEGKYMAALSCFFEAHPNHHEIENIPYRVAKGLIKKNTAERKRRKLVKEVKKDCIKFIKKNFPGYIEIDIDGAKPAKDVVVRSK
jgi:hypothetical protein